MNRGFRIEDATEKYADAIAMIHLAAMDTNPLLHAQFPSHTSLVGLERLLAGHTRSEIRSTAQEVIVAFDLDTEELVGFAKWNLPSETEKAKLEAQDVNWPHGCRQEYLDLYRREAAAAKKRAMADEQRYNHLTFICTKPSAQGRGVGSHLMKEAFARAQSGLALIYLESTWNAIPFYTKLGFQTIDAFHMMIPKRGLQTPTERYEEVCMIWKPRPWSCRITGGGKTSVAGPSEPRVSLGDPAV